MNWDVIEGKWDQLKGNVRSKWAKLTDDDVNNLGGKKDTLVGKLQERYGLLKDDAERQIDDWIASMGPEHGTSSGSANHVDAQRDAKTTAPARSAKN